MNTDHTDQEPPDDPVYIHSRREAWVVILGWLAFFIIVPIISVRLGYDADPATISTIFGIPSWVVWGVMLPWFVAVLYTMWFSMFYVKDEDLGAEPQEPVDE